MKKPSPDHQRFVDWWHNKFKELFEVPYQFDGKKDGENVRKLLATYGMDLLCQMSMALFRTDDAFIADKMGYTISALKTKSNQLAVAVSGKKAAPEKTANQLYIEREHAKQRKAGLRE